MSPTSRVSVFFTTLVLMATASMTIGLTMVVGPAIEARYWPVIEDDEIQLASRDAEGYTLIDVWVTKKRECTFQSQSFLVGSAGKFRTLRFERPGLVAGGPRPLGHQSFGLYRFDTRAAKPGETIIGIIHYRCHALWDSTASYGPWPVP